VEKKEKKGSPWGVGKKRTNLNGPGGVKNLKGGEGGNRLIPDAKPQESPGLRKNWKKMEGTFRTQKGCVTAGEGKRTFEKEQWKREGVHGPAQLKVQQGTALAIKKVGKKKKR